jgi:hypothetical protein
MPVQGFLQDPGTSVRRPSYLYEHMFPRLKTRFAPGLLGRIDRLVELSTLGGYGLDEGGHLMALEPQAPARPGRLRDDCPYRGGVSPQRCDDAARA